MVINICRLLRRRKEETEFLSTSLGAALISWKIAHGYAIHGNHTFYLPLEEVRRRWDIAHEAEATLVSLITTTAKLLKATVGVAHIIEVEIGKLEARREAILADPMARDTIGVGDLDELLEAARTLLAEIQEE